MLSLEGGAETLLPPTTCTEPQDREEGSKNHVITDAGGVPLACLLSAANRNDVSQLIPLVEAIPRVTR